MLENIRAARSPRKSRAAGKKNFSRARKRLRDLERILDGRHAGGVPDTDDADLYLGPVANAFRVIAFERGRPEDAEQPFRFWCESRAPDLTEPDLVRMVQEALVGSAKLIPDDVVGKSLRVSYGERQQRKAWTIGSFDVDRAERKNRTKARKRDRDRNQKKEKRRAAGKKSREVYEAESLSRTEPWKAEGICRRTWERRKKAAGDAAVASVLLHRSCTVASVSPDLLSIVERQTCDTSASPIDTGQERRAPQAPERPTHDVVEVIGGGSAMAAPPHPTHVALAIARAYRLKNQLTGAI